MDEAKKGKMVSWDLMDVWIKQRKEGNKVGLIGCMDGWKGRKEERMRCPTSSSFCLFKVFFSTIASQELPSS